MDSVALASGWEPWAVRTGQVFLVEKVILEFSGRPSGREKLSFPKSIMAVQILNLHKILLAFQQRQFRPNPIFE
jgi:hypothetical protein